MVEYLISIIHISCYIAIGIQHEWTPVGQSERVYNFFHTLIFQGKIPQYIADTFIYFPA